MTTVVGLPADADRLLQLRRDLRTVMDRAVATLNLASRARRDLDTLEPKRGRQK